MPRPRITLTHLRSDVNADVDVPAGWVETIHDLVEELDLARAAADAVPPPEVLDALVVWFDHDDEVHGRDPTHVEVQDDLRRLAAAARRYLAAYEPAPAEREVPVPGAVP